jgi:hypothetical protein
MLRRDRAPQFAADPLVAFIDLSAIVLIVLIVLIGRIGYAARSFNLVSNGFTKLLNVGNRP